ncbi:hypothetical protein II5_06000 [Bacillus cereus MSX-A1]|nr:hypothetical protein II5_06000 [Bacillus cereus MSX-A1]
MLRLNPLQTDTKMTAGIEVMHMIKKGQTLLGGEVCSKTNISYQ